ncbi:MAG: hypothetical protein JXA91_00590 [Candidatus Thermoplasmatota archaeon]|nr:hypothetical protein [Candidatus Thermoplasmatota archaeon]
MRGKSTVPKDALINGILSTLTEEIIRDRLNLGISVNVNSRIHNLSKSELVELIKSSEKGEKLLANLEEKYPLIGSPTLYLVISKNIPTAKKIIDKTTDIAKDDKCVLTFSPEKTIRSIYNTDRARVLNFTPYLIEIPVFYERRIDFTSTDPENWGENLIIYDLRRAFIWISNAYNHGLIACSDYSAISPIITWANNFLEISLDLPNIPLDMFYRLAEGGLPRTATFASTEMAGKPFLDIQSLTVYDQDLKNTETYKKLQDDNDREQWAGYFSQHPTIPIGGLGIARRYGRIWTPSHLPKDTLLTSAINLISRTEEVLTEKLELGDKTFLDHYKYVSVNINGKPITKEPRKIFNDIAWSLYRIIKKHSKQEIVDNALVLKVIEHKDVLGFITTIETDCKQCGFVLVKCPECLSPYEAVIDDGEIKIVCPIHRDTKHDGNDVYKCECGEILEIILPNNIKLYPGISTTQAFRDFISQKDLKFDGWFLLDGNLLRSYPKSKIRSQEYHLKDLNLWRLRAHIHVISPVFGKGKNQVIKILKTIKEKCNQNNWHPSKKMCDECYKRKIILKDISNNNFCLPRLIGLAIDIKFDGIHHQYEEADIKYHDNLIPDDNRDVYVGIHLKSREKDPPRRGVGQASSGMKGLYAQLFFSIYKKLNSLPSFDLIGVSIPNKIYQETRNAMVDLTTELGYPILVLDEEDWLLITAAAIETIENQQEYNI